MAAILLKNRKLKFVTAEQGAKIWRVKVGEIKGTKAQRAFVKQIQQIYLNRQNNTTPERYKEMVPDPRIPKDRHVAQQIRLPYADG